MQLGTKGAPAQSSGTISTLKISASAITFDILSSGIYNDKPRAIIRELSCNAWDAHKAAGKGHIPFVVTLPTQWDPTFSVLDNGTGLKFIEGGCKKCHGTGEVAEETCPSCDGTGDHDSVKLLYCTYFASDKNDSDDMIGGFGLGSKSPFAYTKGFIVINRYNGKKYTYSAMVNNGIPSVAPQLVEDTTEENGVEVKFPVQPKDIWEFENKAALVFEFFEPKPILNKNIIIRKANYSVKTDLWGMRSDSDGLRAIMGNVQYTVGNIDQSRLSVAQKQMVGMPIDLFFNIGELHPAVSREILQLDDITINNILKRLDIVQSELLAEVKKQVEACATGWEARLKIHSLTLNPGIGGLVNDAFNRGMFFGKYKNFDLSGIKAIVNELDYNHVVLTEFSKYGRKRKTANKDVLIDFGNDFRKKTAHKDIAVDFKKKTDFDHKITVDEQTLFVYNDLKVSADKYIHYMLQEDDQNTYTKILLITRCNRKVNMLRAEEDALAMRNRLGHPPMRLASSLKAEYAPTILKEKANRGYVRSSGMKELLSSSPYYRGYSSGWRKIWRNIPALDMEDINPTETKFFISLIQGSTEIPEFYSPRDFIKFVNRLRASGLVKGIDESTTIYGVKSGAMLDSTYVNFMPYVRAAIKDLLTPEKQMELSLAAKPFCSQWMPLLDYIASHPHVLAYDSPIRAFAGLLQAAKSASSGGNNKDLVQLASDLRISISNTYNFDKAWTDVLKNYPMLQVCGRNSYHGQGILQENNIMVDYLRYAEDKNKQLVLTNVTVVSEEEEEMVNV